ncbi:hypothetical protein MSBRW_1338 [Methanosarcina barkeri str. Wiesmoor]|uniref:Uncharacterized protein n=2 Tax=Methanosarcina barkeri TaxID=2208 RepID=A0A0E3LL37_METBA|nr:hypothetical protein MSBRW_1338 [Methanosarcina barkeri str. Wiesmoor]
MVFVPTASAQDSLATNVKPSEIEQGLIDALNSNTKNLAADYVIANYCKANNDNISIPEDNISITTDDISTQEDNNVPGKSNSRTYQLEDGSNITFTNRGHFLIENLKVNNNTVQPVNKENEMNLQSENNLLYTPLLISSVSEYNSFGWKLFTIYTKGYFRYDNKSVQPYHVDSWYVHNMPFNLWQISNWKEGEDIISNSTAEVYSQGNFHYGFGYKGNSLTVQNYYVKVYLSCDQNGNYGAYYSVTELIPTLKIGSLNMSFGSSAEFPRIKNGSGTLTVQDNLL